jgi:hypothetical protein
MKTASLLAALLAAGVLSGSAGADPSNTNSVEVTLNCPGRALTGVTIFRNNAVVFQVEGETFVAISQAISFVDSETGELVVVRSNPGIGNSHELATCTYMYPGFPVLVTGEFLITGHG